MLLLAPRFDGSLTTLQSLGSDVRLAHCGICGGCGTAPCWKNLRHFKRRAPIPLNFRIAMDDGPTNNLSALMQRLKAAKSRPDGDTTMTGAGFPSLFKSLNDTTSTSASFEFPTAPLPPSIATASMPSSTSAPAMMETPIKASPTSSRIHQVSLAIIFVPCILTMTFMPDRASEQRSQGQWGNEVSSHPKAGD